MQTNVRCLALDNILSWDVEMFCSDPLSSPLIARRDIDVKTHEQL